MSFENLDTLTQNMNLADTDAIFEQGRKAFRALFPKSANPFKNERDRKCWEAGYMKAEREWWAMFRRWSEIDRGERE